VAQAYNAEKPIVQEAFYKSMLSSYRKVLVYCSQQFLMEEFKERIFRIKKAAMDQRWFNAAAFQISDEELLKN
jgi:hypothetical protein